MRGAAAQSAAAIVLGLAILPATAETIPPRGQVDPRVRVVAYNPDDVIKLHGYVGYQIHLQWAPGEEFVALGAGDGGGFDIGVERNHFFIKPKQAQVSTNITVLTTARAYHFDYSARKPMLREGRPRDQVYSLRFTYPHDDAKRQAAEAQKRRTEAQFAEQASQRPRNRNYAYCGTPSLKPASAFDDGLHTRLRFAAGAELPALFVLNDDGSESLLNFHVEHDEVVIHRVARRLVLRRGDLVGCVVNQSFASAIRPKSYTTAPAVQRETQGATR